MKKHWLQKVICAILSVATLFCAIAFTAIAADGTEKSGGDGKYGTNRDTASSLTEMENLVGVLSYDKYLEKYGEVAEKKLNAIEVKHSDIVSGSNGVKVSESEEFDKTDPQLLADFGNPADPSSAWNTSIYLPAQGKTTWNFLIPDNADYYYYIKIEYYTCNTSESSVSSVERKLLIDGVAPFDEARNIALDKSWVFDYYSTSDPVDTDEKDCVYPPKYERTDKGYYKYVTEVKNGKKVTTTYTISQDINGNSMLPNAEQISTWNTYYCKDSTGYYEGNFKFYLLNGTHQLTLQAEREPVVIKSITLEPAAAGNSDIPKYEDVKKDYANKGYTAANGGSIITLEAEFPDKVSDSSVYPTNDKTSAQNSPSAPNAQVYNVIGKNSYNSLGQWAAYNFSVDKTGLYKIGMRYMQSALQGMYICRTLKLAGGIYGLADGTPTVPFREAYDTQFNYDKKWQSTFVSDSNGNEFEFYFEEGKVYTLYIECSLGSLKDLIQRVENCLDQINDSYLKILQLTGASPDKNTNYEFHEIMPDVLVNLLDQAIELMAVKNELVDLCGTSGSHIATLETIAILLDTMGSNEGREIAANMSNLKSYLGTLGTWINDSKKGQLIVDNISICPSDTADKALPKAKAGFFKSAWFEITSFFYSFFVDYEVMGLTTVPDKDTVTIDVWLATGRDQSNIWRTMIDADGGFTDSTGYAVTLKLVVAGTLLPSILSGKGPDVYIGLASADVINYAIREAVIGVSGNDKFLTDEQNAVFKNEHYIYKDENGEHKWTDDESYKANATFVSQPFEDNVADNYVDAAMDTLTLLGVSYGLPETMNFAMMFYRMDVLADLGIEVPDTWSKMLSILPNLQANNMQIGVAYINALDFMIYQKGGNMWKYTDNDEYAGSKIDLDSDVALESFEFVCRLYTDYSFPVTYDAANRFRTGEMPITVGDYVSIYNTLTVYATEIDGLWEFCPLPGSERVDENGNKYVNYDSLASITATVILHGCENLQAAWTFFQWQTSAEIQANYGNKMVALIGPSAKYASANVNAIKDLSWTADEREAIEDQMAHMSSIVNYPGSYIIARYMKFAFLDAVNDDADPVDALSEYIDAINAEITRKREEFELKTLGAGDEPPIESNNLE